MKSKEKNRFLKQILFYITIAMFLFNRATAQDLRFLGYNWNYYEDYNRDYHMSKLEKRKKLTRTKWTISGSDTTNKVIDLEVVSYNDRFIIQKYEDDGTVDEKRTVIFVAPNKTIEIWEYIDESYYNIDSMFMTYDSTGMISECISYYYSFDTLSKYWKSLYFYNEFGFLSRIEETDASNSLVSVDSFFYNSKGNREKIKKIDLSRNFTNLITYERNKWVNDKLYQVIYYNSDGTISNRNVVPSNPVHPNNICVIKRYNRPTETYLPAVSTTIIEKTEVNANGVGYRIKEESFEDNEFRVRTIYTYDELNRIIEEKSETYSEKEKVERNVYQYTIIYIE